jgi:hypothetical protein
LVLEVLRCVLRKSQGIEATWEEFKRANQILSALLDEYAVPPLRLKTKRVKESESDQIAVPPFKCFGLASERTRRAKAGAQ